jgi:hypothetical protein
VKQRLAFIAALWLSAAPCEAETITATPGGAQLTAANAWTAKQTFNAGISIASGQTLDWNSDTFLARDAANSLAMRNGANAQAFTVYNSYTDASNNEGVNISWTGNAAFLSTFKNGTGTIRSIHVQPGSGGDLFLGSTDQWKVPAATGNFLAGSDNATDIGTAGANRPRSLYVASRAVHGAPTVTYSASITIDASTGNEFTITANNGTAFTINAPTNPTTGQRMVVTIRNTSGGALGAITWNAVFKMATFTAPANANSRSIEFRYDGTNWVQLYQSAADVPN